MSDIIKAVGDVRTMARQAQALQEVVAVLDSIGPLDQAVSEAKLRVEKARKEADDAATDLIAAKAKVKQASDEANTIAEGAASEAERVIAAAQAQADQLVATAKEMAEASNKNAQEALDAADDALQSRRAEVDALGQEIATKQKALAQIEGSIAKLRARLGE